MSSSLNGISSYHNMGRKGEVVGSRSTWCRFNLSMKKKISGWALYVST